MHFVSAFLYCAANWSHLGTVFEEDYTITQVSPPEIWKLPGRKPGASIRIHRVWVSSWGQYKGFENSWMVLMVITKVQEYYKGEH